MQENTVQEAVDAWGGECLLPTDDKDVEHPLPTAYIETIYEEACLEVILYADFGTKLNEKEWKC